MTKEEYQTLYDKSLLNQIENQKQYKVCLEKWESVLDNAKETFKKLDTFLDKELLKDELPKEKRVGCCGERG
jgi:hypothetical protein